MKYFSMIKQSFVAPPRALSGGFYAAIISLFLFGARAPGADTAPPSPGKSWAPQGLEKYEQELAREGSRQKPGVAEVQIDPKKIYDLPELIDIAERNNPETRVAWEHAREAAAAVGLSKSAYYPYLAASAASGYERAFLPFPTLKQSAGGQVTVTGGSALPSDFTTSRATLTVKWLLVDFGQRRAAVDAAGQRLMMANVGFNATHQLVVFNVTQKFYALGNARQRVEDCRSALESAQTVERAARARLDQGLAVKTEYLQAQQQTAQRAFELDAALGLASDALVGLVESLGLLPTIQLRVADDVGKPLPVLPEHSLDGLIDMALSQRSDLIAKLANLHAREAELREARAEYYPKISVDGNVSETRLEVSMANSPYFGSTEPVYGARIAVELPIFDGFARREKVHAAEAGLSAAESELAGARDAAVREVWKAYTDFKTALHKQDSAEKLLVAAKNAYDAVFDSYKHGLGTYVEVASAQSNLTMARGVEHDTRSAIFETATTLALAVGELAKPHSSPTGARR
ncbi:MAG: TolC family protein [Chthoniobacteraceae bacterium]